MFLSKTFTKNYSLDKKIDLKIFVRPFFNNVYLSEKVSETKKGKIIVTRRCISADKESMSTLKWEKASDVIRRLNFENKSMFGPILNSTSRCRGKKEIEESNKIIQHQTEIPIMDICSENFDLNIHDKNLDDMFYSISSFPLVNKIDLPDEKFNLNIEEMNNMRNFLQSVCKDSPMPSVSVIIEKTMPQKRKEILENWKVSMIKKLGEEGFQKYHKELLSNGADLHSCINSFLMSTPESQLQIKDNILGFWKSVKSVFSQVNDVKLLEERIQHPFLCYKGIIDCFAVYKNHLVVIDWKTSKKSKLFIKDTYDNPLQIAAYAGALNFDPKYQYLANKGLIVVAYEDGSPASLHFMDEKSMLKYWKQWLDRVQQFWKMRIDEINK